MAKVVNDNYRRTDYTVIENGILGRKRSRRGNNSDGLKKLFAVRNGVKVRSRNRERDNEQGNGIGCSSVRAGDIDLGTNRESDSQQR